MAPRKPATAITAAPRAKARAARKTASAPSHNAQPGPSRVAKAPKAAKSSATSAPKRARKANAAASANKGIKKDVKRRRAATSKVAANSTTATNQPTETSRKRKRNDEATETTTNKKFKLVHENKAHRPLRPLRPPKAPRVPKPPKKGPIINAAPAERLNVFVCGEGSSGELGLGTAKNSVDVKRPRLNPLLNAESVGVVQIAVGGMHCAALTIDNQILTWGVNDHGALGRATAWDGGLRDADAADSDSDASDSGLNPLEATPTPIPSTAFPDNTIFVQLAASDSATFALTDEGKVYGWGTFRCNDGILGFDSKDSVARTPVLVAGLKNVVRLACGDNHVLALTNTGDVFAWGSGQQNQLGRRVLERTRTHGLIPRKCGFARASIKAIYTGAYHSFAVDAKERVWAWGLNNYGETGILDNAGEDGAAIMRPTLVPALTALGVTSLAGGAHHSLAAAANGQVYAWGRVDGFQAGIKLDGLSEDVCVFDTHNKPRILKSPMAVSNIEQKVVLVAAGSDHSIVITEDGKAYAWGFSAGYQTGLGTDDDVEIATVIENTAVKETKLVWCGAGGQFSVLAGKAQTAA